MERRDFIIKGGGIIAGLALSAGATHLQGNIEKSITNNQNRSDMKTGRMKTFDVPHKGLRNGLSQLSLLAGKTDYNKPEEIERLNKLGKEVFLLLNTHANDENDVSLKRLEEKMKGASNHDIEEHIRIHVAQSGLEKMLDRICEISGKGEDASGAGSEFYSSLADFHAEYLIHMSEEERVTQQLLWDNFTDEELAGHRAEIMKTLPPDTLLLWFRYIAPAQSPGERAGLFKGVKAGAPPAFFERTKEVLAQVLTKEEYNSLMVCLN